MTEDRQDDPTAEPVVQRAKNVIHRYFARFDDGEVMRWAFRGLLLGAVGVLGMDFADLARENGWTAHDPLASPSAMPILPPAVGDRGSDEQPQDPRGDVTADEETLRQPIRFSLESGGVLVAEGSIEAGAARRFAAELEARGEYIRTVSLNSPGGSLDDALAIAKLIREHGLETRVAEGALCASSCPLVMAGGTVRSAEERSAVGLHQFYAIGGELPGAVQAMSDAQATTARISRHLADLGVDPAMWLHALETPPRSLYYLTAEEMRRYRLVTGGSPVAESEARPKS